MTGIEDNAILTSTSDVENMSLLGPLNVSN